MSNICTTIEQSKKLLELGLNVKTADMYWDFQQDGYVLIAAELGYYHNDSEIPCWSLTALLELMPLKIKKDGVTYYRVTTIDVVGAYYFVYKNPSKDAYGSRYWIHCTSNDEIVSAAFEMVCWLLEQGYIKIEKL